MFIGLIFEQICLSVSYRNVTKNKRPNTTPDIPLYKLCLVIYSRAIWTVIIFVHLMFYWSTNRNKEILTRKI